MKYYSILFALLLTILNACNDSKEPEAVAAPPEPADQVTLTDEQMSQAGIEVGYGTDTVISNELLVNGVVDVPPQNIVSVSFPLGGYLKTTELLPGMQVRRGQVIARIEDPALVQLQQDYLVAKARLPYLEADFQRQKTLNESKVSADKVYQQVSADYAAQKALVSGLAAKLRLVNINPDRLSDTQIMRNVPLYSPINGYVSKVNVNIGKYVNPADVLFELINPADLHAALTVFEKDLPYVRPKQEVKLFFVEDPDIAYDAEVLLVTKNVDDNRSALVHCHFETQPKQLLPGMFLKAKIQEDKRPGFLVPEDAVVHYGQTDYVIEELSNLRFRLMPVDLGPRQDKQIAVTALQGDLKNRKLVIKNAYAVLAQMMNKAEE